MVALEREQVEGIANDCYVDIYIAGNLSNGWWPWRMQHVNESGPSHVDRCESYILDSSYRDRNVGNRDVFDRAHELGADMVVLADVLHDMDATVDAVRDGLNLLDNHPCEADPIIPLQPPHSECYRRLEGLADRYAIGGVNTASTSEKVEAAGAVRNIAGQDIWLHGLGYGLETPQPRYGCNTLVYALNENPGLLDSLDYSTPIQNALNQPISSGDHRTIPSNVYAGYVVLEAARLLSPSTRVVPDAENPTPLAW